MLNDIMNVFKRSVAAFREELSTREPEDQVAELLMSMRKELVAARAAIPEFEADLKGATAELASEREALAVCERRREMAQRIGDAETVRVAEEFAAKHRGRVEVLEQKVATATAELELQRREADEMKRRYQEAEANRFALLAQVRRAAGSRRTTSPEDPFSNWARMEEKVERDISMADAFDELSDSAPPPPRPDPNAVEDRLKELKRRMGRDGSAG